MRTLIILLILSGCGNDSPVSADTDPNVSSEATQKTQKTQNDEFFVGAKLIETKADIEDCIAANYRKLIYVVENKQFVFCSKDGEWESVDLTGPQGIAGKDGKDGVNGGMGDTGKSGVAGANGITGTAGKDGKDASVVLDNEWIHPITGKKWFLGRFGVPYVIVKDTNACPTDSHNPGNDEMSNAARSGIFTKLKAFFPASESFAIIGTSQSSSTEWILTYINISSLAISSSRINSDDIQYSTLLDAFWKEKKYVVCVIN